jgi:hypothetical protein
MLIRPSSLLTQTQYTAMQQGARVLEQDERGPKVFLLADGTILKVFRPRNRWSRDTLYSNARSFCRNADRLTARDVPTVRILQLYHLGNSADTAVLYTPLPGETLRDLVKQDAITPDICRKLGAFVAGLHRQGIYFRSLHFGNILYTEHQTFGLIDIADMNIYGWPLFVSTRIRNFKRIQKYHEDMLKLGQEKRLSIMDAYIDHAGLSGRQASRLLSQIRYQPHLDTNEA